MLKIAVLISGSGSNLQSIIDKKKAGFLEAEVVLVASNNPDAKGLERAKNAGIPTWAASHKNYSSRDAFDRDVCAAITASGAELIVLAGYMRLLSKEFIEMFSGRIINLHPAVLPSFPGTHGGRDAQNYGVKITGCTVHFVEEIMDSGPVIIQAAVPTLPCEPEDALMQRIHAMEHRIYPQAIQWFAEGRISATGRAVKLAPANKRKVYPTMTDDPATQWLVYPSLEEGF